jgi:hypothetical protein
VLDAPASALADGADAKEALDIPSSECIPAPEADLAEVETDTVTANP